MKTEYIYFSADGLHPSLKIERIESENSKTFLQFHREGASWKPGKNIIPISPYDYPVWKEKKDEPLFLVEGEKCAEKLKAEGLFATTTPGGANAWKKTFASFFKDRQVIVLPDNDEPGKKYAEEAAADILEFAANVKIVELSGLGNKEDVYDFLRLHTRDELLRQVKSENELKGDDDVDAEALYPIALLPPKAMTYLEILRKSTDGSPVGGISSLFAVLGCLYGSGYKLESGESLNDYYILVGKTGSARKTTLMDTALDLFEEIIKKRSDLSGVQGTSDIGVITECAQKLTNFSAEGLEEALKGKGFSLLLCPPEYQSILALGQRSGQANTIAALTSMYDGKTLSTRLRNHQIRAENYTNSLLTGSTETWLKEALSDENVASGFLNRHLIAICNTPDKHSTRRSQHSESDMKTLVDLFAPLVPIRKNHMLNGAFIFETVPKILRLNQDAWKILDQAAAELHQKQKIATDAECGMMARELTHAYKLAGHHTVLREKLEIDKEAIFFGLTWAAASTRAIMDLVRTKGLSDYEKRVERLIRNNYRETKDGTPLFFLAKKLGGKQANRDQALHSLIKKKLIERTGGKYYPVLP